eukprot:CAMPEP_0202695588 /NCGR_PEP_ID=MMETSP1385-20130828/9155_1 /ASSEMBLY_ACC=CAM_ASM_000861 /TAXON_ID=933848 /ORGANISM="Elphidium margaritaceum" /LENGTH=335 /DNA_ID=CAMNT_0049351645 /DNA_START=342 /DNA_END=1349 /DNA_ORIENTATION=-
MTRSRWNSLIEFVEQKEIALEQRKIKAQRQEIIEKNAQSSEPNDIIVENFLHENPSYSLWQIARETGIKVHDVWKVLKHQYRGSQTEHIHISKALLRRMFQTKDEEEIMHKATNLSFKTFQNYYQQKISKQKQDEQHLTFFANAQYGDFIEFKILDSGYHGIRGFVLGYGPNEKNMDAEHLYLMKITSELSGTDITTIPYEFGDAPLAYFHPVFNACSVHSMDILNFMTENNCFQALKREMKLRLYQPEYDNASWGEDIEIDKFPHHYVACMDTQLNGNNYDGFLWEKKSGFEDELHSKRIKYAVAQRKERIYALLKNTSRFADDIVDVLVDYLI